MSVADQTLFPEHSEDPFQFTSDEFAGWFGDGLTHWRGTLSAALTLVSVEPVNSFKLRHSEYKICREVSIV